MTKTILFIIALVAMSTAHIKQQKKIEKKLKKKKNKTVLKTVPFLFNRYSGMKMIRLVHI